MRLQFKFIAAFIAILILAGTGVVNAQNPDLSQNPVPDQATNPSEDQSATMDQAPSDQMSNDGNDQGGPDYQNDQQNERPPMSELPPAPKPSPSLRAPAPPQSSSQGNYTETAENSGAARLSLIHGNVSTQRGDSGDWSAAQLNAPLVTGDGVSTGDQARTELQLDYANLLRLAEHTQANITNLTRSRIQIQFGHGMGNYTVLRNSEAEAEIDTPNVAIRTNGREASFRILVTSDDHTEVLVRRGEVELTTPQGSTRVGENQFIVVKGLGDQTQYRMGEAPARDDWDQWNTDRDRIIRTSVSRRHTNDYYVGTEDLDSYGNWRDVPDYGSAWFPAQNADWTPYSTGRWVWEPYWGWTWVDYQPWGWAPYHYGRWFQYNGAWGWWPGPVYGAPYYRPIWAPAYVSFFGFGGGFGLDVGFGWGSIGWFPIGPCDRFYPWWGGYRNRYNVTNITNINITNVNINNRDRFHHPNPYGGGAGIGPLHRGNRFSNVRLAATDPHFRAVSVASNQFGRGGHTNFERVNSGVIRNAHFTTGNLPVVPSRESLSASGRAAAPGTIVNRGGNQRFFLPRGTAVSTNRSFENERTQLSNSIRQSGISPIVGNQRGFENRNMPRPLNSGGNSGTARTGTLNNGSTGGFRNQSPVNGGQRNEPARTGGFAGNNREVPRPGNSNTNDGFRPFSRSGDNTGAGTRPMPPTRGNVDTRGNSGWGTAPRPGNTVNTPPARQSGPSNNGGWEKFTPMPQRSAPQPSPNRSFSPGTENRGNYGSSRFPSSQDRSYSGKSRPPLNMRQPIVTPRSYGNGGNYGSRPETNYGRPSGPSYGSGRPAPSYGGGPSPSYSRPAPSYGGGSPGYSRPAPSYGGGGGRPAPSYGGGSGGRSAPAPSSGGGHSAPSGGSHGSAPLHGGRR